jgi:hypothetical protein
MSQKYSTVRYACYDKYPTGQSFQTNADLLEMASSRRSLNLQQGTLQAAARALPKLKAAFKVESIWDPQQYPVLKIAFLDGTDKQQQWVQKIIGEHLEPLCSQIEFQWNVPIRESHIRISFKLPKQAWSMLGTDALKIPMNQPTMNLGWLDDDENYNAPPYKGTGQVVKHEFGHAMGMIHEHQNPHDNPIQWNREVVYEELRRTNGWDAAQVDNNMFKKYGDAQLCQQAQQTSDPTERKLLMSNYCAGELVNGSSYDPHSIMHYFFPPSWIESGPKKIPVNVTYSPLDKKWIQHYYGDSNSENPMSSGDDSGSVMGMSSHWMSNVRNVGFLILGLILIYWLLQRKTRRTI